MGSFLDLEAQNNNIFIRLKRAEEIIAELQRLVSTQVFRRLIGDEGALGNRAVTDTAIAIGLLTGPVEKLHVYDGNLKVEGQGFEDVTGGTIYLQNKPSLVGASPADNDVAGNIKALAVNAAGNPIIVVDMYFQCTDVTEGSEDGAFRIVTQKDYVDAFVFNVVRDRVGINELDPAHTLHIGGTLFVEGAGQLAIFGSGLSSAQAYINGAAGSVRDLVFSTGGSPRAILRLDGLAESGANAGSNVTLNMRDDSGNSLNNAISIRRSDGSMIVGSPTGSYQGAGRLNAVGLYDDGAIVSPYPIQAYLNGTIDLARLDSLVPNRTIPAKMRTIPAVTRTIPARVMRLGGGGKDPRTGRPIPPRFVQVPERVEIVEPEREEEVEPESIEERIHLPARRFAANMAEELDPEQYAAKWKRDGHLPAFPSEAEWEEKGKFGLGDLVQRLMETAEVQAVHIDVQQQQIAALEARLAALEGGG